MSSLIYFIRESFTGFARHLSTTLGSIITLFLSLLMIGAFLIAGNMINNVMASIENEVSITVYIADDAKKSDITSLQKFVKGIEGVSEVGFTDKEQALEKFKESMSSNPEIFEQLDGANPLPQSIDVNLSDPQLVEQVANQIAENETFKKICDNPKDPNESLKYGQKTVENLFQLTNGIRVVGIAAIALLVFIALVFINNTIRLAVLARRKEIAIMRLVGASSGFIRGPFLMESILHAVIGALMAVGVLEIVRQFALPKMQGYISWLPIDLSLNTFIMVYVILLAAGLVISFIGAAFSMRRYLKV